MPLDGHSDDASILQTTIGADQNGAGGVPEELQRLAGGQGGHQVADGDEHAAREPVQCLRAACAVPPAEGTS